ncbi:MAG: cytochrome P450 [Cyclobacteriaceae bacterium]|nr:cytochrome P450 [Cyclobacteriaceae bacterium]
MTQTSANYLHPPEVENQQDLGYTPNILDSIRSSLEQYGDIYRVKAPGRNNYTYVINHPQYVKHVLHTNHRNYLKGMGFDRVELLLGNGLIVSDGEFWKRQRQMIQPAFHRKVITGLTELIIESNSALQKQWQSKLEQGQLINIYQEMSKVTLHIVLTALFSEDLPSLTNHNGKNPFDILTDETERNLLFAQRFRALGKLMMEVVHQRRAENRIPHDFVGMMMSAKDKISGEPMKDKHLLDEIITLIVAGHETTASSLSWIWYLLSQNPQAEAKLHQEIEQQIGGRLPQFSDLEQLKFTQCVIDEALRLYPPVWLIPRKSKEHDQLGGYHIEAGSDIFISPFFLHRDQRWWSQPEAFQPLRFQDGEKALPEKYSYIPFSAGPRRCIGDYFSMVEMKLHLALLIPLFKLKYHEQQPLELEPHINLRSKNPIMMEVISK